MPKNMNKKDSKKLRIAMLGHKRIPSREGGVEIVVASLATKMAATGHSVTCYNRRGHHVSGADFDNAAVKDLGGVKIKSVLTVDRRGLAAMTASFSAAVCAAFGKYDVVHFHAEGPCAMLWLPKLFGKRCIATVHGLDHKRAKWGRFASWYILTGEKCAVRFADEIIVLSESVKQYFADTYGRETVFIPNGVSRPAAEDAMEITTRFGLEKDSYILYLGRLVPEKGIECLIKAYKNAKPDKKLVIAGGSSDTADYAALLKDLAGDDENIIFTDFVEGRVLRELYSNAYLYVLPSFLEGMPLSLLEAMSYGNMCLTSDIPECTSVIGECGETFKCGDEADLATHLTALCASSAAVEKYKENAADYICSKYNWDTVTAQTLELYSK